MAAVSELLYQHIGEVEKKLQQFLKKPEAIMLQSIGCQFLTGVQVKDPQTGMIYEPYHIIGNHVHLDTAPQRTRALSVYELYLRYISSLDPGDVHDALELESRRVELKDLQVRELLCPGGRLWTYAKDYGVTEIEVLTASDSKVRYLRLQDGVAVGDVMTTYISRMSLFLTEEEAYEHSKVKRSVWRRNTHKWTRDILEEEVEKCEQSESNADE